MSVRVGIVTYLKARGLGYDAVSLRAALADVPEIDLSFFPVEDLYRVDRRVRKRPLRPAPVHGESAWPEAERFTDIERWVRDLDVLVTLEVFLAEIASTAFERGVALVHVPNLEWVSEKKGWLAELRSADLVIAKTAHTLRALESLGVPRTIHVPWSVPLPREAPRPTGKPVTLFHSAGVGASHDSKNPEAVLAAFTDRLAGRDDVRLVFKSQVPIAKRRVPLDLDLIRRTENIQVVEGELPYQRVLDLNRKADVAVFPSRTEGFGLPLLESLTLGVPVITTDAPPMNEVVVDGVNGRLIPAREAGRHRHVPLMEVDRGALADALETMTDPARVDELKAGTHEGLADRWQRFATGMRDGILTVSRRRSRGET
ncbi:MAG: glycosyltransferase [Planctomycetota bacterium]